MEIGVRVLGLGLGKVVICRQTICNCNREGKPGGVVDGWRLGLGCWG